MIVIAYTGNAGMNTGAHLDLGHVEAMSYHKYGLMKERLVRMRDGSVVGGDNSKSSQIMESGMYEYKE